MGVLNGKLIAPIARGLSGKEVGCLAGGLYLERKLPLNNLTELVV